ncbi:hypothetical protein LguiB_030550 [Lonicera macranthoides]
MLADIFPQKSLRDHHHQDSRIEAEPVVSVEKVSTLLRMIVGLQNILVSKMLESRDRLNASNVQEYEGNQNRNGDEEDGLVTSEVVPGAGGGR